MRKKGVSRTESPEKMPVKTTGIEMTRGSKAGRGERLTGGNAVADESGTARLVIDFIKNNFR